MLTRKEQDSLNEGSLIKYVGELGEIYRYINNDQIVIHRRTRSNGSITVWLTDVLLTIPTDAELLAHRLRN